MYDFMLGSIAGNILPPHCLICGSSVQVDNGVCRECTGRIIPVPKPVCDTCGRPIGTPGQCLMCHEKPPPFDRIMSVAVFEGLLKDSIHAFKYNRATIYKRFFAHMLYEMICNADIESDILTFVPLHWTRQMQRGYNQSALIARELSGYIGVDVRYNVLRKVRRTCSQVGLGKDQRKANLKGAFTAADVDKRSVLVVDDVITTGQTAFEVSSALRKAGASYIVIASIGRNL